MASRKPATDSSANHVRGPSKTFTKSPSTIDVQTPSKTGNVIQIVNPQDLSSSVPIAKTNQKVSTLTKPTSKAILQPDNSPDSSVGSTTQQLQTIATDAKPSIAFPSIDSPIAVSGTLVPSPNSSLDVFSRNYIPRWLRMVNESASSIKPCPTFPTLDEAEYIAKFAGPDFVQTVAPVPLPPPTYTQTNPQPLSPQNYVAWWSQHMQNEFASQNAQCQSFALYNQEVRPISGRDAMFHVNVPGLREHAPRIDLGDTIHLRLLRDEQFGDIEFQVGLWLSHGRARGMICPGFSGLSFDPHVWEIDRVNERITLRMRGFPGPARCNVIFLLQQSKIEPLYRAVRTVNKGTDWLRKMLFPEASDGVVQTRLSTHHFGIPWIDELNREQKKAVHTILAAKYGIMPYLISGPPGTGKTKTLVETALQLLDRPGHLLICAPSDAAADTLTLRLSSHLKSSELFRLNGSTRTFAEVPDRVLLYSHSGDGSFTLPPVHTMLSFRIVVTTCRDADILVRTRLTNMSLCSLFNGVTRLMNPNASPQPLHWTSLLVDEAAQATEPDVLVPLTVVMPPDNVQSPQFIAAGDQYQLGPKLVSKSPLEVSLFQRLFDSRVYAEHPLSRNSGNNFITSSMLPMLRPPFTNLIRNYRSHPAILSVPSSLFYNDTLITERKTSELVLGWSGWQSPESWPVMFWQNDSEDAVASIADGDGTGAGALYNPGEAIAASEVVSSLLRHSSDDGHDAIQQHEIMVMTPFRAQASYLRKHFRSKNLWRVNIGPLEAFQGLESRIVIICTTRTRVGMRSQAPSHHVRVDQARGLGIIDEPSRLNVAMTRAQEGLIVIGNANCLVSTGDKQWLNFLDFCKRNQCCKVPDHFQWPDLGESHRHGRLERALMYAKLQALDAERTTSTKHLTENETPENSVFKLKGLRQTLDDEMWQLMELVDLQNDEHIDTIPAKQDVDDYAFEPTETSSYSSVE